MKKQSAFFRLVFPTLFLFLMIPACSASSGSDQQSEMPLPTERVKPLHVYSPSPTSCTGWSCEIKGRLIANDSKLDTTSEFETIQLLQISNCSPTKGIQESILDHNGTFSFSVYLHDTDSFVLSAAIDGYQPEEVKFGGFDCLYCSCDPFEILISPIQ